MRQQASGVTDYLLDPSISPPWQGEECFHCRHRAVICDPSFVTWRMLAAKWALLRLPRRMMSRPCWRCCDKKEGGSSGVTFYRRNERLDEGEGERGETKRDGGNDLSQCCGCETRRDQ